MFGKLTIVVAFSLLLVQLSVSQLESCTEAKRRLRAQGVRLFRTSQLQGGCALPCLEAALEVSRFYCCSAGDTDFFAAEVVDLSTGRRRKECLPSALTAFPFLPSPGVPLTPRPLPQAPPLCSNQQVASPDDFTLESYTTDSRDAGLVEQLTCRFILVRGGFPVGDRTLTLYDCIDGYARLLDVDGSYSCVPEEETTAVTDVLVEMPTPDGLDECPFEVIDTLRSFRRDSYSFEIQSLLVRKRCFFVETRNGVRTEVNTLNYFDCQVGTSRVANTATGLIDCV